MNELSLFLTNPLDSSPSSLSLNYSTCNDVVTYHRAEMAAASYDYNNHVITQASTTATTTTSDEPSNYFDFSSFNPGNNTTTETTQSSLSSSSSSSSSYLSPDLFEFDERSPSWIIFIFVDF